MEDKNKYYTFYVIKRIWKNYASGSMKLLLIALFCNAIVALTTPALPELIRRVIDDIFVNSNREMLTILPLIAILIMFIRALGTYGANVAINYIGQKIVGFLQKDLYKAILNSDMSYINSIHSARFISSFTADTTKLRETMSSVVVNLSRNILMVLGLVGYLFYVDPTLATIFFLVLPPAAIGLRMLGKRLRKAIRMSLEEIGTLSALVSETLKGMRIIRAFGKERIHSEKASSIIDQVVSLSMKGVKARSASAPIMEIVTGFAIAGIIYYAGNKSLDGLMSVGSFMAFTTAAGLLYDPLKAVANLQAMLQEGVAASQRLFPILDNKPKIINPDITVGEFITKELPPIDLGRVAAQNAKGVIIQKVREADKSKQYEEYKDKIGELAVGIVKRIEFGNLIVDLGKSEAIIKREELIPRETFKNGDRVRAYIYEVKNDLKGYQVFLSRTHPQFVAKLFAQEVPEIYEGVIKVKSVARDPGSRAKISIYTEDSTIDPVGACVGMRGSRVQAVVN